ncbi:MAG: RNA polymerase sigma factor [Gemmataceae bacterium]
MSSDPNGLLSLFKTHGAELHALFTRLTLRADVAEDLLQELFLKLQSSDGFAGAANRKAYAFRAAIHLAFDWRRAQRPTEPLRAEPAGAGTSPLDRLIDAEELEQILEALQQLSELGRQVVVLRYLHHQEYAEIADQLGKTEHQARALCFKALEQLRTLLRAPDKRRTRP